MIPEKDLEINRIDAGSMREKGGCESPVWDGSDGGCVA